MHKVISDYKIRCCIFFIIFGIAIPATAQISYDHFTLETTYRMGAEQAEVNSSKAEVVEDERLTNGKGITLKDGVPRKWGQGEPDASFSLKAPAAGYYVMSTHALTDEKGAKMMEAASGKYESLFMKVQIDGQRPTKRVIYVPWNRPRQETGKFKLTGQEQELKIWLPRGVRLDYVEFKKYTPPAVPEAAKEYHPEIKPPANHPRLWVNSYSLPKIKARLEAPAHQEAWEKVAKVAKKEFELEFDPEESMPFNVDLEKAAKRKAFYYLMTKDREIGREAIELMTTYMSLVEFGNILDITRERGRAIYTAALIYDWCHDLMSADEKESIYEDFMRLSMDMESGWPPFKVSIVNGHGNEAQINRDLLAMSIAIYNKNPKPYQYISYIILEQLIPMRAFEYQSPRHNQGVNYGAYRFGWEMHAAWLFYRMVGEPVFDDNIKGLGDYWLYMRRPDGQMLRDGDGFSAGKPGSFYYWDRPETFLLMYAYANDPLLKGEYQRQGGLPEDPVLYLLLNDPDLPAEKSRDSLPLTKDFGSVLGSMVARTGWDISLESNDVVAEIKGGGYHFGNHQHADAGSLQIYYRGQQVGDLGLYKFYGTPYDYNFNKRSISHSMMLAVDPDEKYINTESNDGGTRFNQRFPKTPEEAKTDPWFDNGRVVSTSYGPSEQKPAYSYFKVDLTAAYSSKMSEYSRSFCFLNLDREDIPAVIILADDMTTSNPSFKKYWQVNTLNPPDTVDNQLRLHNQRAGLTGNTYIQMLKPVATKRVSKIYGGEEANSSFEFQYKAPPSNQPEASGQRIMVTPKEKKSRNRFFTVFQMTADDTSPLPVESYETAESEVVVVADRLVSMSRNAGLIRDNFKIKVPDEREYQILLADLKPGFWNVRSHEGDIEFNVQVLAGKNTLSFEAVEGEYIVTPGRLHDVELLRQQ